MTAQVLISHSAGMAEIATEVLQALQVMIPGVRIARCSLPRQAADGGDETLATLKQELAGADTVIGLITADALTASDVPFQLGAAWALGKRVLLLLSPEERATHPALPLGQSETVVLGPESLIELARSLASAAGLQAELGPASTHLLMELFPSWSGPARDSTERAVPTLQPPRGDDTQQMWLINQGERSAPSEPPPAALARAEETTQVTPATSIAPPAPLAPAPAQAEAAQPEPEPKREREREREREAVTAPQPSAAEPQKSPTLSVEAAVANEPAAPDPAPAPGAVASAEQAPGEPAAPAHERAPEPAPSTAAEAGAEANLPSPTIALKAGCAIAERAWSRDEGSSAPIDDAFGNLLQTLGSDWNALSRIGDVDVWMETADNVLGTLGPQGQHVRGWYDVGYQATLLLNLARRQLELDKPDEAVEARWQGAWALLRDAAGSAGLAPSAVDELHKLLENLRGPARDYTNLGRAQERVAGLADRSS